VAQTLVRILVHLIFSTKDRTNLIQPDVESELHAYLAGIANNLASPCFAVNGTTNHVHMLVSQSKNLALARLVEEVKKGSSKWIKTKGAAFRGFYWQDGYAAFSVSESKKAEVERYIAVQKKHHQRRSFQEELIEFLRKHGVEHDERYIWK
jgi:REP element-mobilizing transposase RayT